MSAGFTLVETLIALVLTLLVTGSALALASPASRASALQPEVMDIQQRARVAADVLTRELNTAGAGLAAHQVPALLPLRLGSVRGDSAGTARADAVTMLSVPVGAAETTTAAAMGPVTWSMTVSSSPTCMAVLCGWTAGADVLVADASGRFDLFRITRVSGGAATLRPHGAPAAAYTAGAFVTAIVQRTFERDAATAQLRVYDGDQSDQPVVDHVAALSFRYFAAAPGGGLVEVPLASLADGPWVSAGSTRVDRDVFRIRLVRVALRAEASAVKWQSLAPALPLVMDIAPRALSVGR